VHGEQELTGENRRGECKKPPHKWGVEMIISWGRPAADRSSDLRTARPLRSLHGPRSMVYGVWYGNKSKRDPSSWNRTPWTETVAKWGKKHGKIDVIVLCLRKSRRQRCQDKGQLIGPIPNCESLFFWCLRICRCSIVPGSWTFVSVGVGTTGSKGNRPVRGKSKIFLLHNNKQSPHSPQFSIFRKTIFLNNL